jgi:DNA-binding protein HU-beta
VNTIAQRTEQSASTVNAVLSSFEEVITESVTSGDKVTLPGFLTFERSERSARTGRNPATGEEIQIPAATVPKVKIGKSFKDSVNG